MDYKFKAEDACDFAWVIDFCVKNRGLIDTFVWNTKNVSLLIAAMVEGSTVSTLDIRRCVGNHAPRYLVDFFEVHLGVTLGREQRRLLTNGFVRFRECVDTHNYVSDAVDHLVRTSRTRSL